MIEIQPIGVVRSSVDDPSRDENWGGLVSVIDLDPGVLGSRATAGLAEFSHIVVVFHFHKVAEDQVESGTRHPRGRTDWPEVGILAQRAKRRPNRLGVTTCRLLKVDGLRLRVLDLDAIEGTPVVNVKPYMIEFGPHGEVRQPQWATELMSTYYAEL